MPTFKEGTVCFVSGGPYGPEGRGNSLILDFYCQHLRRVLFVFASGGPYGPKRGGNICGGEGVFCIWGPLRATGPREGETFSILDLYC